MKKYLIIYGEVNAVGVVSQYLKSLVVNADDFGEAEKLFILSAVHPVGWRIVQITLIP